MAIKDIIRFKTTLHPNGNRTIAIRLDGEIDNLINLPIQSIEDFLACIAILNGPNPVYDDASGAIINFNAPTRQNISMLDRGGSSSRDIIVPENVDPYDIL